MDHDNHDDMSHDDHGGDAGDQGQGGGRFINLNHPVLQAVLGQGNAV